MRKAMLIGIVVTVAGLTACASGGSSRVVHYGVGYSGGWGPWGGYYGGPPVIIDGGGGVDVGPDLPAEPEFEATPLPEIPDDF